MTSHDVVARIRGSVSKAPPAEGVGLKGVKVGHSGTLDPFATGLLLILVGRATRVQRVLMALPKRYETIARLGWTSTTGDRDGEIAPGRTPPEPLLLPTGTLLQRPHPYSAVKVGGRRAYARSRAGEVVELPEREVDVSRFELLWRDEDRAGLAIDCAARTYVRSLVADLADAYCLELRRTGIGPFEVGDADPERVLSLTEALAFLPEVRLEGEQAQRASHGVAVPVEREGEWEGEGMIRLTDEAGLIALALPRPDGLLKPTVGFRS